ncbi:unnamed protein product, partial [Ectocarpus sp. 8 AP-2014]
MFAAGANDHGQAWGGVPGSGRTLARLPSSSTQRRMANQGLQDLYDWLGGDNWKCRDGWLDPGSDVREWHGLTITTSGDLVSINLISNDLEGEMPESLCNLYSLQHLNLSYNFARTRGKVLNILLYFEPEVLKSFRGAYVAVHSELCGDMACTAAAGFLPHTRRGGSTPSSVASAPRVPMPIRMGGARPPISGFVDRPTDRRRCCVAPPWSMFLQQNLQLLSIEGNEQLVLSRNSHYGGQATFETSGSSNQAWEAAEEAIELHTAA